MTARARDGLATLFALLSLAAQAGCGKTRTLACDDSIAEACAAGGMCVLTWDEVQAGRTFCAVPALTTPMRADCGGYHAVTVAHIDANTTYYYDGASGMLAAIVLSTGTNGTTTCTAGPSGGFAVPTCTGAASEPLPQCLVDGGADAIAAGDGAAD